MALFEFVIDLKSTAYQLSRIADAMDRLCPPPTEAKPRASARFINVRPEDIADYEDEEERKQAIEESAI